MTTSVTFAYECLASVHPTLVRNHPIIVPKLRFPDTLWPIRLSIIRPTTPPRDSHALQIWFVVGYGPRHDCLREQRSDSCNVGPRICYSRQSNPCRCDIGAYRHRTHWLRWRITNPHRTSHRRAISIYHAIAGRRHRRLQCHNPRRHRKTARRHRTLPRRQSGASARISDHNASVCRRCNNGWNGASLF